MNTYSLTAKKVFVLLLIVIFGIFLCACGENTNETTLLRLHIRANSNSAEDQAVKLKVRDEIVLYLETELSGVRDLETAKRELEKRKARIIDVAESTLRQNGFTYGCRVRVCNEFFPTRMYENLVVESGYYDALIIELGDGTGDNWWCVIYPPLCYLEVTAGSGFKYKSKINELIKKYFG